MTDRLERAIAELAAAIRAEIEAADARRLRPAPDRLYSIDEAAGLLGVGRSTAYAEIGAGRLRSLKVGRRRLIPAGAIEEYINRIT